MAILKPKEDFFILLQSDYYNVINSPHCVLAQIVKLCWWHEDRAKVVERAELREKGSGLTKARNRKRC